jgi:hypothetical protein
MRRPVSLQLKDQDGDGDPGNDEMQCDIGRDQQPFLIGATGRYLNQTAVRVIRQLHRALPRQR